MIKIIEVLIALYCFFGMLTGVPVLIYAGALISITVQLLVLLQLIMGRLKGVSRIPLIIYTLNMAILVVMTLLMLLSGYSISESLNRILSLLSIVGLTIIFCIPKINISKIVKSFMTMFALLGVAILVDSFIYSISGSSLWPPKIYISERFSGPFFDPNFMSITYAFLLIIGLYKPVFSGRYKLITLAIFGMVVVLGGSWSAIGILVLSILIGMIWKSRNFGKKQIVILVIYTLGIFGIYANMSLLADVFESTVSNFGVTAQEASMKFISFEQRIEAQVEALGGIVVKPFGHGPHSIVADLGRDTHNSYIGIAYELGILGILLILLNITYRRRHYDKMNNILTTFFFLIALTINIHYSSIFLMLLLAIDFGRPKDKIVVSNAVKKQERVKL